MEIKLKSHTFYQESLFFLTDIDLFIEHKEVLGYSLSLPQVRLIPDSEV